MKKLILAVIIIIISIPVIHATQQQVVIYLFDSAVCPVCRQVKNDLPGIQKQYQNLRVINYEIVNKSSKVDSNNQKNISILNNMLSMLDKKMKGKSIVQKDQKMYPYINIKGVPHYVNKLSEYTTIKVEFGVPIFIIGDKVLLGYNKVVLEREIRNLHK